MRGSPLVRAALAFLVILALGWPLRELTGETQRTPAPATPAPAAAREIELQLTFTSVPKSVRVSHLGQVVWEETSPTAEMDRRLTMPFPAEGVDLVFAVEFPESAPQAAMRARLTSPAGETFDKSLWGAGRVEEVLPFP